MPQNLSITDKILKKTVLWLIPRGVTPNMISWLRFLSVPVVGYFLWVADYSVALPLFFISASSDALDGAMARTRNQITDFGKLFDPLADKLLIATAALTLIPRFLDWDIVLAIVFIDLFLISSGYFQKLYYGQVIQAENTGKIKMILQSFGIGVLLLYALTSYSPLLMTAQYLFYGAIFFALMSLVVYRAI